MKKAKSIGISLFLMLVVLLLSACGNGDASEEDNEDSKEIQKSITISGSSAMQPLVAAAAAQYMEEFDKDIIVNAGGSGTGLSEVSDGTVNIGNSDVFAEEKEGITANELIEDRKSTRLNSSHVAISYA